MPKQAVSVDAWVESLHTGKFSSSHNAMISMSRTATNNRWSQDDKNTGLAALSRYFQENPSKKPEAKKAASKKSSEKKPEAKTDAKKSSTKQAPPKKVTVAKKVAGKTAARPVPDLPSPDHVIGMIALLENVNLGAEHPRIATRLVALLDLSLDRFLPPEAGT